jgi:hypothetical protein
VNAYWAQVSPFLIPGRDFLDVVDRQQVDPAGHQE